jgi:hypothetical protein
LVGSATVSGEEVNRRTRQALNEFQNHNKGSGVPAMCSQWHGLASGFMRAHAIRCSGRSRSRPDRGC